MPDRGAPVASRTLRQAAGRDHETARCPGAVSKRVRQAGQGYSVAEGPEMIADLGSRIVAGPVTSRLSRVTGFQGDRRADFPVATASERGGQGFAAYSQTVIEEGATALLESANQWTQ